MSKLINLVQEPIIKQYNRGTVIYYCKKCDLLRKGTIDEDVALFWEHKNANDFSERCLLKDQYTFTNGSGGQDINIFVMGPK